jgi:hypothetical protein
MVGYKNIYDPDAIIVGDMVIIFNVMCFLEELSQYCLAQLYPLFSRSFKPANIN